MTSIESSANAARGSQIPTPGVQWHEIKSDADLTAAMQEAAQKHEPLVLELGATWCVACRVMDQDLAQDGKFNSLAGQAVFARLETDKYKLHQPEFLKNYKGVPLWGYPQNYVVDAASQKVLTAFEGYPGASVYTDSLEKAFKGTTPPLVQYNAAFDRYEQANGLNRNDEAAADALKEAMNIATTSWGPTSEQAKNTTFNLGDLYDRNIGDKLKAESFFKNSAKILEANPDAGSDFDRFLSLYRLQLIYQADGRFSEAISMLEQEAKLSPEQVPDAQQQIDRLKAQAGDPKYQQYFSAVREAETADTQQDYRSEIGSRNTAVTIAAANFGATSREAYDSTINLGLAYQKAGDPHNAEQAFLAAAKIIDAVPASFKTEDRLDVMVKRLEYLYERTGQYDKAIAILQGQLTGADSDTKIALQKWIDRLKAEQK
jgi:tetratricopeptide (TPR) repeat protein